MANRIVTATVTGETIKLSDKNAGAAGSFNAVSLALTFDSAWDDTTKKLYFFDSFYANPVYILLTVDYYNIETGVYTVPIPAEPLAYAGNMTITIKGVDFATDGTTAERIIMSASTEMKVASAIIPSTDTAPAEPTPTQAEQLLASVNSVTGMTVTSETLASGSSATVTKSENVDGTINLDFGLPTGDKGDKGDTGDTGNTGATGNGISSVTLNPDYTLTINFTDSTSTTTTSIRGETGAKGDTGDTGATGNGIASIVLVSGTHAAGTTDTYRITMTNATTFDFTVYNGADGEGAGDMLASVYDPSGKNADAFDMDNMVEGDTNKLVSATEKTTWSGKQDALGFTPANATHTHGNLTNDGKIGSTSDLPVFTTTDGAVTTKTIADAQALLGIGGGGLLPRIIVTVDSGSTVTATCGDKTVTGTSDGTCVLDIPDYGTWNLTATLSGKTATESVVVDQVKLYTTSITYLDDTFSANTWEDIIGACQSGSVPAAWVVGNQKTMTINGASYTVTIIGKNHDTYTAGGTAPLTFQLQDCYGAIYQMNADDTNIGGWTSCAMRGTHLPAILALMPSEVQAGIKQVNKLSSAGSQSSTINTTADKLFLLSEIEIFGSVSYSKSGEGSQYAYYSAGNSKVKNFGGSANNWWERSPYGSGSANFCTVTGSGSASKGYAASASIGVAFGFCF